MATSASAPSSSSTAERRPTLPSLRTLDLPLPFPLKSMSANANVRLEGPGQPASSHDAHDPSSADADADPACPYPTCYTRPHPWQRQPAQHGRHPYWPYINARRGSGSSSRTASPSPPPPPIAARRAPSSYPHEITNLTSRTPSPYFPGPHFRLVPSTFAEADAVVVYPYSEGPHIPELEEVIRRAAPVAESESESDETPAPTLPTTDGSRLNQNQGQGAAAGRGKAFLVVGPVLDALRGPDRKIAKGARVRPYRMVPLPLPPPSLRRLSTVSTASS